MKLQISKYEECKIQQIFVLYTSKDAIYNLFSHFIRVYEGFFSLLVEEIKIKRKFLPKRKWLLGNFLFLQFIKRV